MEQILLAYGQPKKNCYSHNDVLSKHESQSSLTGWRHKLLLHCGWSSARKYISTISVYNLSRLHTLNVDRSNKRKRLYTKKGKKADDIQQKL